MNMKYPDVITQENIDANSLIPDEVIEQDIKDTEAEILSLEKEIAGLRLIAQATAGSTNAKMTEFLLSARQDGLDKRKKFVEFIAKLLESRRELNGG